MFSGPMKYSWFVVLLGPNVINILMFQCFYHYHPNAPIDVFMRFLKFCCFYHYVFNQSSLVHIDDRMKMLIFYWL